MRNFLYFILGFVVGSAIQVDLSHASSLTIQNKTGAPMRVEELRDACGNALVTEMNIKHLKPDEKITFKDITPVIHTYVICGSGFCAMSAMGVKGVGKDYLMEAILDEDGHITAKFTPDHWVGTNKGCPK